MLVTEELDRINRMDGMVALRAIGSVSAEERIPIP
jgi:hypothetical protein